jgi:signal transduction histidine kinase
VTARSESDQQHGPSVVVGADGRRGSDARRAFLRGLRRVRSFLPHGLRGTGGTPWHRRPEFSWLWWWLFTGLLALVLLPLNAALGAEEFDVSPPVAFVAGVGQSTALVLTLVQPRAAVALQFLAVAVLAVAIPPGSESTWPLTVPGMITLIAHVGLVTARTTRRAALTTWWGSALLLTLVVLLDPRGRSIVDGLTTMILYLSLSALAIGVVLVVGRWREIRRELADARHDVEVEQSQRAVAEERTRIARELHDVVAHSMSVIHMQATSASYRITNLDPEAKAEFTRIAADARSAMREMRQLLAVLRDESAETDLAPVPDLSRLPDLVDSAERAGVPLEVRETGAVRAAVLPERVALAAYRIIQESLSNVIRHSPGARTTIGLDLDGSNLVVSVENGAAARPAQRMEAVGRAGHGLAGMRERVRQVGGSLETGARDGGGYRVAARLPIGGDE